MNVETIPPEGLQPIPGLDTPQAFYRVLRTPASLAGMSFPQQPPWNAIAAAGFESIVCLTDETPPYDASPLRILLAMKFEDLAGRRHPTNPQREADMLREVVQAVVEELRAGRGVVVHCLAGTGRTGVAGGWRRALFVIGHVRPSPGSSGAAAEAGQQTPNDLPTYGKSMN